jgi:UDP-N-acetylglucosamine 3-dehydrogenase
MTKSSRREFLAGSAAALTAASLYSQSTGKISLGIVGTGHRAWSLIHCLNAIPDYEIIALADPTPEFRDQAAKMAPQAAVFPDCQKMLAAKKPDAVLVVTPGGLHAEPALAALARGCHVFCEKPMATTVEDANRMIAAAHKAGKVLQIGQQHRSTPAFAKMAELVQQGRIGPIEYINGHTFRGDWNPKSWKAPAANGQLTNWRFLTKYTGSSLCEDGLHEMDVMNWLVGSKVARVYASGGNNVLKGRETVDHAALVIDYENGVRFEFGFSLFASAMGDRGRALLLIGSEGAMEYDAGKVIVRMKGAKPEIIQPRNEKADAIGSANIGSGLDSGTYLQFLSFRDSIRAGKPPVVSGQIGKDAIKMSLLAEKSLRERRIVTWDDLPA